MAMVVGNILTRRLCQPVMTMSRCAGNFTMQPAQSQTLNKDFWNKNKELSRPMSPFTVYKMQLTSTLSISHRITGLGASVVLYGAGIGALVCSNTSFPEIVQLIQQNVPHFMILTTKSALGGSIIYHTLNGIRHLVWDVGYGFQLKHLYRSGYVVVALTALGTALIFIKG